MEYLSNERFTVVVITEENRMELGIDQLTENGSVIVYARGMMRAVLSPEDFALGYTPIPSDES